MCKKSFVLIIVLVPNYYQTQSLIKSNIFSWKSFVFIVLVPDYDHNQGLIKSITISWKKIWLKPKNNRKIPLQV